MIIIRITIDGMSCGHCVAAVKREFLMIPNLKIHDVKVGSAVVELESSDNAIEMVKKAVETAGYDVVSIQ